MRLNSQIRLSTKSLVSLYITPSIVLPVKFLWDPGSLVSFVSPLSILRQDPVASLLDIWMKCLHYIHCSMIRSNTNLFRIIFPYLRLPATLRIGIRRILRRLVLQLGSLRKCLRSCTDSASNMWPKYSQSIPAAPKLYISYNFCRQNCDGFGLSQGHKPSQWAAPMVQFTLPSVIFSMTIPRRRMFSFPIELNRKGYGGRLVKSLIQRGIRP